MTDSRTPIMQQVIDKILSDWADRGKIIEGGWQAFLVTSGLEDAPAQQLIDMHKVWMLGAQHLFASIMSVLDPGEEPSGRDLRRMDLIHAELEAFRRSLVH